MLEVELKYSIPDSDTFARLLTLTAIGDYAVKEPAAITLTDRYLDVSDGAIRRGGFACRLRHIHSWNTWKATVKGLGRAEGALHRRPEYEVTIASHARPNRWLAGPARDLATQLSSGQTMVELFSVYQQRCRRRVVGEGDGPGLVAFLSLDRVEFSVGTRRIEALELENELTQAGTLDHLQALGEALAGYGLRPKSKSKFERGL